MFSLFNKPKAEEVSSNQLEIPADEQRLKPIEIPENIFIEKEFETPQRNNDIYSKRVDNTIELLFDFLDKNHENKGYEDALMNPDTKHLDQNIEALKNQLERTIRRVKTFYEDFIKEIDFHIDSRGRSGMVDVVDELKMKKSIAESHISKVLEMEGEHKNNIGDSQGMIISYTRGFMNGLSAISHHSILKRF